MSVNDISQYPIGDDIDLLCDAVDVAATRKIIGPAIIQRKVRVGFAKAARLNDLLEDHGVIHRLPGTQGWCVRITGADAAETKARLREIAAAEAAK